MSRNTKKLVKNEESEDFFEEQLEEVEKYIETTGEIHEVIFQLEMSQPKDSRTKEYKAWKKLINEKMKECNKILEWTCYKMIP